jgi:hypothetical protein
METLDKQTEEILELRRKHKETMKSMEDNLRLSRILSTASAVLAILSILNVWLNCGNKL